jgi:hypothetical protein
LSRVETADEAGLDARERVGFSVDGGGCRREEVIKSEGREEVGDLMEETPRGKVHIVVLD